jgi:acetyltransferase-like isoleucine patch superfamily enzyme
MPFPTTLLSDGNKSMIEIGDNCRVNGAYIHAQKRITIGKNCVIAAGVNIIDSNGHELYSNDRTKGRDTAKEIVIGENVWIGLNKDTHIGDNSVVAAGSVVKGIFPANSLIQGNPAVIIKQLEIN